MDVNNTNLKPQTYTALDGTVYNLVGLTAKERAFLDLVYDKYKHDSTWTKSFGRVKKRARKPGTKLSHRRPPTKREFQASIKRISRAIKPWRRGQAGTS